MEQVSESNNRQPTPEEVEKPGQNAKEFVAPEVEGSDESFEDTSGPTDNLPTTSNGEMVDSSLIDSLLPTAKYASMTQFTEEFWKERKQKMLNIGEGEMLNKTKNMSVPMARVKKIMRIDDDVRSLMIASDAPIFMAQAAEFFIEEMTGMGWQWVSESRRRILQKADVATAVQKSEQFDFLIDFLPPKARNGTTTLNSVPAAIPGPVPPASQIFRPVPHPQFLDPGRTPVSTMFHHQVRPYQERKPRARFPWQEEKKVKKEVTPSASRRKRTIAMPTDPATISLSSLEKVSGNFHCVFNETPNGNEFQLMKVGDSSSSVVFTSSSSTQKDTPHQDTHL